MAHYDFYSEVGGIGSYLRALHRELLAVEPLDIVAVYPSGQALKPHVEALGKGKLHHRRFRSVPSRFLGSIYPLPVVRTFRTLVDAAQEHSVGVVHLHSRTHAGVYFAALAFAKLVRRPLVLTSHLQTDWSLRDPRAAARTVISWIFLRLHPSTAVIGVSWASLRGLTKRPAFVSTGIDLEFFHPSCGDGARFRRRAGLSPELPTAIFPARYSPEKNRRALLQVAEHLRAAGLDFQLVAMGPTRGNHEYRRRIEAETKVGGLPVKVLDAGTPSQVRDALAASDFLLFPSLTEGQPLAILEGFAMGKPVVAFEVGGLPELIVNGREGLLAPAGDVASLARFAEQLFRDPKLALALGRHARERSRNYSLQSLGRQHRELYRSLAG